MDASPSSAPKLTTTQRLAQLLLEEPLGAYLAAARARRLSWRLIAEDIRQRTQGEVHPSPETVRLWAADLLEEPAA